MAKPELGLKRLCPSCGAKFYDLNHDPILCPKCGAHFDSVSVSKVRAVALEDDGDGDTEDTDDLKPEFVSLEDAEHPDTEEVPDIDDEADIDNDHDDDDVFLEEEDEEDGDMTGIIHDVGSEEEH